MMNFIEGIRYRSYHDIQDEAAICQQVMLLARKVVALGAPTASADTRSIIRDVWYRYFRWKTTGDSRNKTWA